MPFQGYAATLHKQLQPIKLLGEILEKALRSVEEKTHNKVDCKQNSRSAHQTHPSAQSVNDLSTDNGTYNSNCVDSSSQTVLLYITITCLGKQRRRIGSDSL
jgi:hypothetical protein